MGSEVARASKGDPLHVGLSDSAGSGKESEALLNMAKVQAECGTLDKRCCVSWYQAGTKLTVEISDYIPFLSRGGN